MCKKRRREHRRRETWTRALVKRLRGSSSQSVSRLAWISSTCSPPPELFRDSPCGVRNKEDGR
eukprot:3271102-Rhodomonas_salina.1